jgi:hypothetical protein
MIGLINLNLLNLKKQRARIPGRTQARSSLLGLALDGHRLHGVVVRRSNGAVVVQSTVAASLQLNLLTDDPQLVGREIRNHLDRAGIKERACSVCVPLEWALTAQTPIPDLPPADVESFLNIEAERGFPFGQDTLSLVTSRCRTAEGPEFATLIAMPKDHLNTLQKVLKAAHLNPVSFSLPMPALQDPVQTDGAGVAALGIGENGVELQVASGGGIAALRALQGALEQDGVHKKPYVDVVARDLRITLGQLPAALRQTVQRVKVFGNGEEMTRFADDLATRAKTMGLEVELIRRYADTGMGLQAPADAPVSPALSLALRLLNGQSAPVEFLPPKVSAFKQLANRYSSGKLVTAGAAAGALLLVVAVAFLIQQWQLERWRSRWTAMKPRVTELEDIQQQIRRFRPWFDDSFRCLSILQKVTEAFPEDGAVYAKSIEIRDPGAVTFTGTFLDQKALLKVVDQLRATRGINGVQVDAIRAKQFTINVRLGEGTAQ